MGFILTAIARALILAHEGMNQPSKWPGGGSGITLGRGYDLGQVGAVQFRADWGAHLPAASIGRLEKAIGVSGQAAKAFAASFRDITVTREAADRVFEVVMVPRYYERARAAFLGMTALPLDVQGMLVSLVMNRGPSTDDEGNPLRTEMDAIEKILADGVQAGDIAAIACQFRSMKRIWKGKGLRGLVRRREEEAQVIERYIPKDEGD